MNKYQEALNAIKTEPKIQDYYGDYINFFDKDDEDIALLQELVDKEIELESRKDKLIVGSEWVCVVEHHVEYMYDGEFYIIEVEQFISVTNLTDNIVAFQTDFLNLKCVDNLTHFLLCFKPL